MPLAVAGAAGIVLLVAGTALTHAAFSDSVHADLGVVGGAYEIALVGPDGQPVAGDPEPLVLEGVTLDSSGAASFEVTAVTTTEVTGPVALTLFNARDEPLPPDPGIAGPGADPFDVILATVRVDGEVLVDSVPAPDVEGLVMTGWETDVPRTVHVDLRLPDALGNPYYVGRSADLGARFDGQSS